VTSIGTSVQNSGVSFGLSLPFANSVDNGSDSVVGSIGPSVSVKGSNLDGSSMVTVVTATIPVSMTKTVSVTSQTTISMTKTVSVTSQTSIETTVVTSIGTSVQNSGVSFGLSLPFANSVDNGSDSVVGSIGPAVGVNGSSLDGSGVTVVTSITS